MSIEESIKNCEACIGQIKRYDPDPYYVDHFFSEYIDSANSAVAGIFVEANRDFGLFVTGKISQEKFDKKARAKNDQNATKFSEWYAEQYGREHGNQYPSLMRQIFGFKERYGRLPEIRVMIRATERYEDDVYQQVKTNLNRGRLRSKMELDAEVKRQLSVFLETINHKRDRNDEPRVGKDQVTASAFLDMGGRDVEVAYVAEIYIQVIKRLVEESRGKIKDLVSWE